MAEERAQRRLAAILAAEVVGSPREGQMIKNLLGIVTLLIPLLFTATGPVLAAGETLSIAMVLWRGPTEADRGFKDGLKKLGTR